MDGALHDGEPRPVGIIYEDGTVVSDFRHHTDSDGRRTFSCGICNALATPRGININETVGWSVDTEGILVRKGVEA
jgi:hypothetical protein